MARQAVFRKPEIWVLCFGVWLVSWLLNSGSEIIDVVTGDQDFPYWEPITWEMTSTLAIAILAPFVIEFALRVRISTVGRVRAISSHVDFPSTKPPGGPRESRSRWRTDSKRRCRCLASPPTGVCSSFGRRRGASIPSSSRSIPTPNGPEPHASCFDVRTRSSPPWALEGWARSIEPATPISTDSAMREANHLFARRRRRVAIGRRYSSLFNPRLRIRL